MRHQRARRVDQNLQVSAHQILQCTRRAFVRNVHHVHARRLLEQLRGQVSRRADAGGTEGNLARIGLGIGDQFFRVLDREIVVRRHDQRRDGGERNRGEALHRIVGNLARVERGVRCVRGDHGEEGVAVRRGLRHQIGAEYGVCAGLVFNHDVPAGLLLHPLRDDARHVIGNPTGGVGHDPPDRLRRVSLGRGTHGPGESGREGCEFEQVQHVSSFDHRLRVFRAPAGAGGGRFPAGRHALRAAPGPRDASALPTAGRRASRPWKNRRARTSPAAASG